MAMFTPNNVVNSVDKIKHKLKFNMINRCASFWPTVPFISWARRPTTSHSLQLNQQNLRHIIPGLSLGLSRVSFFNDINPGTLYSISTHREALKQTAVENQLLIEFPEHNSASSINTLISEKSSKLDNDVGGLRNAAFTTIPLAWNYLISDYVYAKHWRRMMQWLLLHDRLVRSINH